jgi:uncharacterized delta-60 repeat protein
MPTSYIQISKESTFPSASNVGKAVIGINASDQITITNSNGITSLLTGSLSPYTASYKVYNAKLTQITEDIAPNSYLTVGKTYGIVSYVGGDDFSNIADVQQGTINTDGCIFIATGTTPTTWTNGSVIRDMNYPVPTVDENTLGFTPYWKQINTGTYYFNFSQSVDPSKIVPSISPNSLDNIYSTYEVDSQNNRFWDDTFNSYQDGNCFNGYVRAIAAQSNGKIIVGGDFDTYISTNLNYIARLNDDGSIDTSFIYGGGGGFNGIVRKIVIQPDGKILVGGDFTSYNDSTLEVITPCSGIARLTNSGSFDLDFTVGSGFNPTNTNGNGENVYDIALQPDGKILVSGWFNQYNGTTLSRIGRLDASGSFDATFITAEFTNTHNVGYDAVVSMALQPDGKVICGGMFRELGVDVANKTVRLDSTGSIDASFANAGIYGDYFVNVVRLQDDGKVLVGGDFNNSIVRVDNSGSIDTSFLTIDGFNAGVFDINVLTSGQVVVAGAFTTYQDTRTDYLCKLSNSGSLVSSYGYPNTFNNTCVTLATQPYGKLLVGGAFTSYGGGEIPYPYIIRLYSSYDVVLTVRNSSTEALDSVLNKNSVEIRQYL